MRFSYPRSFVSLLLLGFTIVAMPLLFALFSNAVAFERLAGMSEQAVHSAVRVTQVSRSLANSVTSLERSARQYAVAGDASFLEAYRANRATFRGALEQLDAMALAEAQRRELEAISRDAEAIDTAIARTGPAPQLSPFLARQFLSLNDRAHILVSLGDQVIDEGIEQLREQAVQARNNVFWLMIALVPTALLL